MILTNLPPVSLSNSARKASLTYSDSNNLSKVSTLFNGAVKLFAYAFDSISLTVISVSRKVPSEKVGGVDGSGAKSFVAHMSTYNS